MTAEEALEAADALRSLAEAPTGPSPVDGSTGVYTLPSSNLAMREWVDIEGSGRRVTRIRDSNSSAALVRGAANAEKSLLLRSRVYATGDGDKVIGLLFRGEAEIVDTTVDVSGGGTADHFAVQVNSSANTVRFRRSQLSAVSSNGAKRSGCSISARRTWSTPR